MSALMWCVRVEECARNELGLQRSPRSHARPRFWVLLRWKEDGATLIFGHAPHFEHEIAHEEAHAAESLLYKPGQGQAKH